MSERADQDVLITTVTAPRDDVALVHVAGEVDGFTAPMMDRAIETAFGLGARRLLVDLQDLTFCGTAALAVLVTARTRARRERVAFVLVCSNRLALRPIELAGLSEVFTISASVETALTLSSS
jgi:anti-sigma B factor antagonist